VVLPFCFMLASAIQHRILVLNGTHVIYHHYIITEYHYSVSISKCY
jgi:hypothetical protein